MNNKILICIMMASIGASNRAALPGIDPEIAHLLAGAADQVNTALERAEKAETALEQHAAAAAAALARADQLAHEALQTHKREKDLLDEAAEREAALRDATFRAEQQAAVIAQLRREKGEAVSKADAFLQQLQALTEAHESTMRAHALAQKDLDGMRSQKEETDKEVRRLMFELASLEERGGRMQGVGLPVPRVTPFSAMSVLNPGQFRKEQQEQEKKQSARKKLQSELQAALAGQKKMQDAVDEALALVEQKDREISELTAEALRLESKRQELEKKQEQLENFRSATKEHDASYVDQEDVEEAQQGADKVVRLQEEVLAARQNQARWKHLLGRFQLLLNAALNKVTK
jgi:hypothetical protein